VDRLRNGILNHLGRKTRSSDSDSHDQTNPPPSDGNAPPNN
jgi:hypothetical protein